MRRTLLAALVVALALATGATAAPAPKNPTVAAPVVKAIKTFQAKLYAFGYARNPSYSFMDLYGLYGNNARAQQAGRNLATMYAAFKKIEPLAPYLSSATNTVEPAQGTVLYTLFEEAGVKGAAPPSGTAICGAGDDAACLKKAIPLLQQSVATLNKLVVSLPTLFHAMGAGTLYDKSIVAMQSALGQLRVPIGVMVEAAAAVRTR